MVGLAAVIYSICPYALHSFAPVEFILYFSLASVLYLSYARRGEIKDLILVHILNNALPTVVFAVQIFL
ncbi:CPBP family glutamic-type intramembrane protease [Streptococcus acidominimus]|uniref:CPBP family glutamic-type intramembrane protease n=1 Tax=Streptococcus acidominimus TaxID=1326 RepID=UPI0039089BC3